MNNARSYLIELVSLPEVAMPEVRRQIVRQALAVLAAVAASEPAPLEGLSPDALLRAVRRALDDGAFEEMEFLSASAAALALFELAQALPPSPERRELGRRLLTRLRHGNHQTFVRVAIAIARTSPKSLATEANTLRAQAILASRASTLEGLSQFALGVVAQPLLTKQWIVQAANGSLVERQFAARLLAHAAREAVARHRDGDGGGVELLLRAETRTTTERLLVDRESQVFRHAAIARGLLAHVDSDYADDVSRELGNARNNSELRRAAASAVAAFELGGAAMRWWPTILQLAREQAGVARSALAGLDGFLAIAPAQADDFACALIDASEAMPLAQRHRALVDFCEGVAEIARDEGLPSLPKTIERTRRVVRGLLELPSGEPDASARGLYGALVIDVSQPDAADAHGVLACVAQARAAFAAGELSVAIALTRSAVDEIGSVVELLTRDGESGYTVEQEVRVLRELDREVISDPAIHTIAAISDDGQLRQHLRERMAQLETGLVAREHEIVAQLPATLRLFRLRALIRLLDTEAREDIAQTRILTMLALVARVRDEASALRRAVCVAMTRAGDALVRAADVDVTDFLLGWPQEFGGEDEFQIVREATMIPELEACFASYVELDRAVWTVDPTNAESNLAAYEALAGVARALPTASASRVEGVRITLAQLVRNFRRIMEARSLPEVRVEVMDAIGELLVNLAMRVVGARTRLKMPTNVDLAKLERGLRSVSTALQTQGEPDRIDVVIGHVLELLPAYYPPAFARCFESVFRYVVRVPRKGDVSGQFAIPATPVETMLPSWVPLSRRLGSFHVLRNLGSGAAGSVLLAVRSEERQRAEAQLVALKVPDYDGGAARSMSEAEFEAVFRDEASALLTLPKHKHLAEFITFDASARPKPVLVMEYVRGPNLERVLEMRRLTLARVWTILDGILSGLVAMHGAQWAHLDVKPPNIVLRQQPGAKLEGDEPVLVDFGLAGRRLRTGCGSPHYGAREVWLEAESHLSPFAADVYAVACIAAELLTGEVLVSGATIAEVVGCHLAGAAGGSLLAAWERQGLGGLAAVLRPALDKDANRRPSAERLRASLQAAQRSIVGRAWPLPSE